MSIHASFIVLDFLIVPAIIVVYIMVKIESLTDRKHERELFIKFASYIATEATS